MQQDKYIPTINLTVPTGWDKLDDLVAHARHRPRCKHTCRLTHSRIQGIGETNDKLTDAVLEMQEVLDEHIARLNAIGGTSNVLQYFNVGNSEDNKVVYSANCYNLFNGAGTMATAALVINGATDQKAGAMTAPPLVLPQVLRLSHENQRVLRGEHRQGILWLSIKCTLSQVKDYQKLGNSVFLFF